MFISRRTLAAYTLSPLESPRAVFLVQPVSPFTYPRTCRWKAWCTIIPLSRRHPTLPQHNSLFTCLSIRLLPGGDKHMDEWKLFRAKWLQNWSHLYRHPSLGLLLPHFLRFLSWQQPSLLFLFPSVMNLGIKFDPLAKTFFFHLRNITRLRPFLIRLVAEKFVHAFVNTLVIGAFKDANMLKVAQPGPW